MLKRREILISELQLTEVLIVMNEVGITQSIFSDLSMGNCKWAKAPDIWFVTFRCTNKKWVKLLRSFVNEGITLFPETIGY